jgi:HEAT repeat protein
MLNRLINALVNSKNEAADDLLLQALRLGLLGEQQLALEALLRRRSSRGLSGIIGHYDSLPEPLRLLVLENIGVFNHALAECGRSAELPVRLAAMRLIAVGRQGKLAYVLSENLHDADPALSKAATEAMVALARWVATETRRLQKGSSQAGREGEAPTRLIWPSAEPGAAPDLAPGLEGASPALPELPSPDIPSVYAELMSQRPEIEAAVARAINVHRGKHGQDLLRAALLLADWSGSKTLAILQTTKHGGQSLMVRRLQQPPDSEHVEAFLLGASHGQLRSHFGSVFSHIDQAPVLDALLRKTHWLKDHQLQLCVHQVSRGAWWGQTELMRDIDRRSAVEASAIAEWLAVSGLHDVAQDERMQLLLDRAVREAESPEAEALAARLRLLRIAMRRKRGASVALIRSFLADPDERIMRMAAREIVRRKPIDFENILLKLMTSATPSVRQVMGRVIGQAGFDQFWQRFDRLDKATRKQAGKAMLKLLPDAAQRLQRRAVTGTPEQRIKALQIVQELSIAEPMQHTLVQLCSDPNPRIRSKAVSVLGDIPSSPSSVLVERLLNDTDARVRANVVEVLEARQDSQFMPVLARQALGASSRERANAIKAMHRMKVGTAGGQLMTMLRDERPDHRISAMWALKQIGWWQLLNEVGLLAKSDGNVRVRRYALGVLKTVAELLKEQKKAAG